MNKFIVNLESIRKNLYNLQNLTRVEIAAVVKSNCYGLGIEKIGPLLAEAGIKSFFVATYSEALKLKKSVNNVVKIFVLYGLSDINAKNFIKNNFIPVINSIEELNVWNSTAKKIKKNLSIVLHIDTGMGRMGLSLNEFKEFYTNKFKFSSLIVELVISHLSYADDIEHFYHKNQLNKFISLKKDFPLSCKYSLAASGGVYLGTKYHFDMVRIGASLFGIIATKKENIDLVNTFSFTTKIIHIKRLEESSYIGYNCNYRANQESIIATLPIGYAQGYPKRCGNKSSVSIGGHIVPVIGDISMELTTIDITSIPSTLQKIGQEVEIIGPHYTLQNLVRDIGMSDNELVILLSIGILSMGKKNAFKYLSPINIKNPILQS